MTTIDTIARIGPDRRLVLELPERVAKGVFKVIAPA